MQLPCASPVFNRPHTSDHAGASSILFPERHHDEGALEFSDQRATYLRHLSLDHGLESSHLCSSSPDYGSAHPQSTASHASQYAPAISRDSVQAAHCGDRCYTAQGCGSRASVHISLSNRLPYRQSYVTSPMSDPVIMHDDLSAMDSLDVAMEDTDYSPRYGQSQLVAGATGPEIRPDWTGDTYFSMAEDKSPCFGVDYERQDTIHDPPSLSRFKRSQPIPIPRGRPRATSSTLPQIYRPHTFTHVAPKRDPNKIHGEFADTERRQYHSSLKTESLPEHLPIRPKDARSVSSRGQIALTHPRRRSSESRHASCTARAVRKGPLDPATRRDAAHMRIKGACNYCREHKRKCDGTTPCGPCSNAFHRSLLDNPCRGSVAENISHVALLDDRRWCPQPRKLKDFGLSAATTSEMTYTIPVQLGFGSPLLCKVKTVRVTSILDLTHHHITLVAPKANMAEPSVDVQKDLVLPVVFAEDFKLRDALSDHILYVVDHDFQEFKWYRANFNVLEKIYSLYTYYRDSGDEPSATMLRNALSLLCLIHACDTLITLQDNAVSAIATELILSRFQPDLKGVGLSTCFLRAQLAEIVPCLARDSMSELLKSLFILYMTPKAEKLPLVIASNVLLTMALESVIFRGRSPALHHLLHNTSLPLSAEQIVVEEDMSRQPCVANSEACASILNARYRDYLTQHGQAWLLDPSDVEKHNTEHLEEALGDVPNKFLSELRGLATTASHYLKETAANRGLTLDRLTARLFRGA